MGDGYEGGQEQRPQQEQRKEQGEVQKLVAVEACLLVWRRGQCQREGAMTVGGLMRGSAEPAALNA